MATTEGSLQPTVNEELNPANEHKSLDAAPLEVTIAPDSFVRDPS